MSDSQKCRWSHIARSSFLQASQERYARGHATMPDTEATSTGGVGKRPRPASQPPAISSLDYVFIILVALAGVVLLLPADLIPDANQVGGPVDVFHGIAHSIGQRLGIGFTSSGSVKHTSPTSLAVSLSDPVPTFVYYHDASRCRLGKELCQSLQETYEQFASRASVDELEVQLVSVDCQKYEEECTAAGITSFPSLIWYRGGEAVDTRNPLVKPNMDWKAVTSDALYGYTKKKIDQGHCNLHNLVGEGATQKDAIGKERQLPDPSQVEEEKTYELPQIED